MVKNILLCIGIIVTQPSCKNKKGVYLNETDIKELDTLNYKLLRYEKDSLGVYRVDSSKINKLNE